MNAYDVGEGVEVAPTFTDRNGTLVDPVGWKLEILMPSGAVTTLTYPADVTLIHDSLGKFHYDLVFTAAGTWIVRATCLDGSIPSVGEIEYLVTAPRF